MLNQIMFTFYKEGIYVVENRTRESWYWGPNTFAQLNPTLKYDYGDSWTVMINDQLVTRI